MNKKKAIEENQKFDAELSMCLDLLPVSYTHLQYIRRDTVNQPLHIVQFAFQLRLFHAVFDFAANAISDKVAKTKWEENNQRGGYVWHTTGSGKTMTSFKSAQLIASSKDADKVIFLLDRIELGTQSVSYTHLDVYKRQKQRNAWMFCAMPWLYR